MKIQDIMTRDPRCVTRDTPVRDAALLMKQEDVGILPVVDGEHSRQLVGVVTDRDIALRVVADGRGANVTVGDVMSERSLATCAPDRDVNDAMDLMASEQVRRIPVVDERGMLVGIVSQADVVRRASNDRKAEKTIESISRPGGEHAQ
ncbi:MAG TPA: CBS domain-containing protein [Gemmatimonadaceae bacterium]|nr:CBS domain-containing protein [Gemmatimonadaceae bacterium]